MCQCSRRQSYCKWIVNIISLLNVEIVAHFFFQMANFGLDATPLKKVYFHF